MNKFTIGLITFIILFSLLIASGAFYTVDETNQVVVTRFGELMGSPITKAGLYFKIPVIEVANYFEKRLLEWDGDAGQIPTKDKKLIWIDTIARWRIKDPLKFMKRVSTETAAQSRLDDIIDAKTRDVISSNLLIDAIRNSNRLIDKMDKEKLLNAEDEFEQSALTKINVGRSKLADQIFQKSYESLLDYGIELVDVKIKRINYVKAVQNKVFERMISERKRAAEKFRSEGQGKKAEIEGKTAKELDRIQSDAYRKAQEIKGKADAEAVAIYADAFNRDPEFYSFLKTLETYKKTINRDTTLILTTDNSLYSYINGKFNN